MTTPYCKKLIEVALPLDAIDKASAREKSIRHGHPSTLHLWWARRPLAAARAVIFAQMVDDPSAHPDIFKTEKAQEKERQRLFRILTVTKLADDRAKQLKHEPDKVVHELDLRLRADVRNVGDFSRVHPLPRSGLDVPDDFDARLVLLRTDHPYSKEAGSTALAAAQAIFESRGNTPRLYRNALVFLAADKTRLQDLDEAVRKYLAWESILDEKVVLNLTPQQVKQAETQRVAADSAVTARIPEVYFWLLIPVQKSPQEAVDWQAFRLLSGHDALAVRVSKKLKNDESLVTGFASTSLKMGLDRVPLWRGNHVAVKQLAEDFARYVYLPWLKDSSVLVGAVRDGVGLLTWEEESFAFADSFDEAMGRYRGLRGGQLVHVVEADSPGLLVKGNVARSQIVTDSAAVTVVDGSAAPGDVVDRSTTPAPGSVTSETTKPPAALPKRFHGTVTLDENRVGRDASRVAEEVIAHLTCLVGATVTVTLEIEAQIPSGASDQVMRIVTENGRTLRFTSQGFEKE